MPRGCEDAPTRRRLHPTLNTLVERILCVGPLVAEAAGLDSPGTLIVHGPIYAARSWISAAAVRLADDLTDERTPSRVRVRVRGTLRDLRRRQRREQASSSSRPSKNKHAEPSGPLKRPPAGLVDEGMATTRSRV